jgi:hypothetical protein
MMWVIFLIFISNVFWLTNSNQNLMQLKKKLYYTLYHHYEKKKRCFTIGLATQVLSCTRQFQLIIFILHECYEEIA